MKYSILYMCTTTTPTLHAVYMQYLHYQHCTHYYTQCSGGVMWCKYQSSCSWWHLLVDSQTMGSSPDGIQTSSAPQAATSSYALHVVSYIYYIYTNTTTTCITLLLQYTLLHVSYMQSACRVCVCCAVELILSGSVQIQSRPDLVRSEIQWI